MMRARALYESVLGFKPASVANSPDGQWGEFEMGPHTVAIGSAADRKPRPCSSTAALEVESSDDAISDEPPGAQSGPAG